MADARQPDRIDAVRRSRDLDRLLVDDPIIGCADDEYGAAHGADAMGDEQLVLRPGRLASEPIDVTSSRGLIEAGEELLGAQRERATGDDLERIERSLADELGQLVRRALDRGGSEQCEAARLIAIGHELGDERAHRVPHQHRLLRQLGDRLHDVVHVVAQERAAEALAATGVAVSAQ